MVRNARTQLFSNVLASGLTYLVAIGIGFVMPRIIYEAVGQESLGIWDLGWSFLIYVSFSGIGFGQAVSYFIARKDAEKLQSEIGSICATGWWAQCAVSLVTAGSFVIIMNLAAASHSDNPVLMDEISRITLYLSLTIGIVMFGDIAHGVLIGQHKSRITEYINLIHDLLLAFAMVAALLLGYGIQGLALVTLILRLCSELVRYVFAFSICRQMSISPFQVSTENGATLLRYSMKTSINVLQDLLVHQSMRLLLFLSMGPVVLAAFSRYATIMRQINRLTDRLSMSLSTVTSALVASGAAEEVSSLYVESTRMAVLISLPLLSVFAVGGDLIVTLWMGPEFVIDHVAVLLASGALLHANYSISYRLLSGLNAHGRIGLFSIFLSGLGVMAALSTIESVNAVNAALIVALVLLVTVHVPHVVFMLFKSHANPLRLILDIYAKPIGINITFLALLLAARWLAENGNGILAATVTALSVFSVCWASWHFVVGEDLKLRIKGFVLRQGNSETGVY
ncbi:MAG: lipopolysaccharide biosynthesis protein [bacterium]